MSDLEHDFPGTEGECEDNVVLPLRWKIFLLRCGCSEEVDL